MKKIFIEITDAEIEAIEDSLEEKKHHIGMADNEYVKATIPRIKQLEKILLKYKKAVARKA